MRVRTVPYGKVDLPPEFFVDIPEGLPGFEQNKKFCLLEHSPAGPLKWLQSVEDPDLAFIVADPRDFFPGYRLDLTRADLEILALDSPRQASVLVMVHIPRDPAQMTCNLLAPLVVNPRTRLGAQVEVRTAGYSSSQSLLEGVTPTAAKRRALPARRRTA